MNRTQMGSEFGSETYASLGRGNNSEAGKYCDAGKKHVWRVSRQDGLFKPANGRVISVTNVWLAVKAN